LGLGGVGVLAVLAACGAAADSAQPDGSEPSPLPGPAQPADPGDGSIVVSHERELRGAWISTVGNDVWPSAPGLSPEAAQAELVSIFDTLAAARMNTVFLQVRPESDAVYASSLEPWSRFLTGVQGSDPGWDPLRFAVEEGHRRGLEIHAWLNPYRGLVSSKTVAAPTHITKTLPGATRAYGTQLWMDPGEPQVRSHIVDVVRDIVSRYDVDGIHFDDYFYPYPVTGASFDDASTFAAYMAGGGTLGKDDWRRSNVDALVQEVSLTVTQTRADARFGISPFGIYRPGIPEGITGLDAWAELYCDPVHWMNESWVDYLVPQLYWPTTQTAQAFGKLVGWWASISKGGRPIFVGHDATKAGTGAFTIDEYDAEMQLARAQRPNVLGNVFYSAKPLVLDQIGLLTSLATKSWALPAATPPLPSAASAPPGKAPSASAPGGELVVPIDGAAEPKARSVVIYRANEAGAFVVSRIIAASSIQTSPVHLDPGHWAVTLVDRRGVESRATPLVVP
jgi:uncharacterized lipoprotein YddW (UPF0748 family)